MALTLYFFSLLSSPPIPSAHSFINDSIVKSASWYWSHLFLTISDSKNLTSRLYLFAVTCFIASSVPPQFLIKKIILAQEYKVSWKVWQSAMDQSFETLFPQGIKTCLKWILIMEIKPKEIHYNNHLLNGDMKEFIIIIIILILLLLCFCFKF